MDHVYQFTVARCYVIKLVSVWNRTPAPCVIENKHSYDSTGSGESGNESLAGWTEVAFDKPGGPPEGQDDPYERASREADALQAMDEMEPKLARLRLHALEAVQAYNGLVDAWNEHNDRCGPRRHPRLEKWQVKEE